MNFKKLNTITLSLSVAASSFAHEYDTARPDSHAPISIMGDHTHNEGEWMASYRYMYMSMDGMRSGDSSIPLSEIFMSSYTVSPESMDMGMHMLGLMYAVSDKLTLMGMANYSDIEMSHRINPMALPLIAANGGSDQFVTKTSGMGDTRIGGLYQFYKEHTRSAHFGLSVSLPTGSIDETDFTPRPGMPPSFVDQVLPVPMQLGSGTFDLLPSLTWLHQFEKWSYGTQANATIRLEDENDRGYQLGDIFEIVTWVGYVPTGILSLEAGISYKNTGSLSGVQEDVGQMGPAGRSVTTAFNENYGSERVDALAGVNVLFKNGHRLAVDVRFPLWQDLDGVQLETDYTLSLGWQKAW